MESTADTQELGGSPFAATEAFPRFTEPEHARRWAQLRALLDGSGCTAAIVSGNAAGRHEIQYLTNAPVRWESFLVAPADGEPHLYVQLFNHVPNMREWANVAVTWAGTRPAETVASDLRARRLERGSIGLIGPLSSLASLALHDALPDADLVDLNPAFRTLRLYKSDEEVAWATYGARICDAAVEAFVAQARPGMREDELGGLMENAVLRAGGQPGICFLVTASMRDGGRVVPAQTWSRRPVSAGDLAVFELSTGVGGYTGQVLRSVAIGGDPPAHIRHLHDVAEAAFEHIVASIHPGMMAEELETAAAIIDEAGCTVIDDVVHGYVGGYLPPVTRTPATRHAPPPDLRIEAGMCLVVQPNVVSSDGRFGVQTGELVTVTDSGARSLHHAPRGLLRAG